MNIRQPKIRSPTSIFFYRTKLFNAEEEQNEQLDFTQSNGG